MSEDKIRGKGVSKNNEPQTDNTMLIKKSKEEGLVFQILKYITLPKTTWVFRT